MKDKLPLVKESLLFMIQQLRHEDRVCLFTFDHEVSGCECCASCSVLRR